MVQPSIYLSTRVSSRRMRIRSQSGARKFWHGSRRLADAKGNVVPSISTVFFLDALFAITELSSSVDQGGSEGVHCLDRSIFLGKMLEFNKGFFWVCSGRLDNIEHKKKQPPDNLSPMVIGTNLFMLFSYCHISPNATNDPGLT